MKTVHQADPQPLGPSSQAVTTLPAGSDRSVGEWTLQLFLSGHFDQIKNPVGKLKIKLNTYMLTMLLLRDGGSHYPKPLVKNVFSLTLFKSIFYNWEQILGFSPEIFK